MIEQDSKDLKEIVNNVFQLDLSKNSRKRDVVDARRVYCRILKDRGYSLTSIGKTIGKKHDTVIHYMNTVENILMYDKAIMDGYVASKTLFLKDRKPLLERIKKDGDVYITLVKLSNELHEVKQVIKKFAEYLEDYENKNGYLPSIKDFKNTMLPLFDV